MNYTEYIESNYKVMLGKPVIKGTRITVELILKKLSEGAGIKELIEIYPHLTEHQIMACLGYAHDMISNEELISISE